MFRVPLCPNDDNELCFSSRSSCGGPSDISSDNGSVVSLVNLSTGVVRKATLQKRRFQDDLNKQ
eukprot:1346413-Amphidinium_carterae.1